MNVANPFLPAGYTVANNSTAPPEQRQQQPCLPVALQNALNCVAKRPHRVSALSRGLFRAGAPPNAVMNTLGLIPAHFAKVSASGQFTTPTASTASTVSAVPAAWASGAALQSPQPDTAISSCTSGSVNTQPPQCHLQQSGRQTQSFASLPVLMSDTRQESTITLLSNTSTKDHVSDKAAAEICTGVLELEQKDLSVKDSAVANADSVSEAVTVLLEDIVDPEYDETRSANLPFGAVAAATATGSVNANKSSAETNATCTENTADVLDMEMLVDNNSLEMSLFDDNLECMAADMGNIITYYVISLGLFIYSCVIFICLFVCLVI